jgi:hypothetical protein
VACFSGEDYMKKERKEGRKGRRKEEGKAVASDSPARTI